MDEKIHEECGVFGVWAPGRDVARLTYFALRALQHRGQESAGIAVGNGSTVLVRKDLGLVTQVFTDSDLSAMPGKVACGHCRYGTAGAKGWESSQPHLSVVDDVVIALAHNGTLVNFEALRRELIEMGIPFRSNTDSEVAAKLIGSAYMLRGWPLHPLPDIHPDDIGIVVIYERSDQSRNDYYDQQDHPYDSALVPPELPPGHANGASFLIKLRYPICISVHIQPHFVYCALILGSTYA